MKEIDNTEIIRNRYNRYSKFYDIFEAPMELFASRRRKELVKFSSGKVLEVGVGTGKNISYYPDGIDLIAIDFSDGMLSKAVKKWKNKSNINFMKMDIQAATFELDTFDTVIASYVFCSVPDPIKGLKEISRICKSGGKIVLLEHVRSDNRILDFLMDLVNPIVVRNFGFNINRNTESNLLKAEISSYRIKHLFFDLVKLFVIDNKK